jgi:hypothetical protein
VAEDLSTLKRVQSLFGVRSTGISGQTARALAEHGEGSVPSPTAPLPVGAAPLPVAGPQPSQELLDRVKAEQERRAKESFKRIMEQRQKEFPQ